MFNKLRKVAISVATSGALVLALGGGLASPAMAQFGSSDGGGEDDSAEIDEGTAALAGATALHAATIDGTKRGVIHLVKYDNAENAVSPNGSSNQTIPAGSNPLDGIEFTLTPITKAPGLGDVAAAVKSVDNDQLKALAKLTGPQVEGFLGNPGNDWAFGASQKATTANGGAIKWGDLDLGVYLLQETNSVVGGKAYKSSPASLVFLPTTNPDGDGWLTDGDNYAVWVYPKNSVEENLKTVNDKGVQVGQRVTYTISSSVPAVHALAADQKPAGYTNTYDLNNFGFWDNLSENLQLLDLSDTAGALTVKYGADEASATLLEAADFVAKVYNSDSATEATTGAGQKLVVLLTSTGLGKVATAKNLDTNTKVFLTFKPKVVKSGIVANKAEIYKTYVGEADSLPTDNVPFDAPKGKNNFPTNTAVSVWGKLDVLKTDEKDTPTPLAGAKFKVYAANDKGEYNYDGDPVSVNDETEFTTDAKGRLTVDGLGLGTYALVETQAPNGFELARQPIFFKIDVPTDLQTAIDTKTNWEFNEHGDVHEIAAAAVITAAKNLVAADMGAAMTDPAGVLETTDTTAALHRKVTVVNIPVKPRLPLTGGAGIAIFGLLGGGLLLGGLYAAKRNSRQAK